MTRPFDDDDARAAWTHAAAGWRAFVRSGADYYRLEVHGPALLEASRVRPGEAVLDVGCGEGFFTRLLALAGARVTGLDLTPALLELARADDRDEPLGITWIEGSATALDAHFAPGSFDLVTSCMAIQDMSDPAACLRGSARVLRAGGRMVFSVPHPASDTPVRAWARDAAGRKLHLDVDRYFDTGPAEAVWNMRRLAYAWTTPYWRRTLEEWSDIIAGAGFVIARIREPRPGAQQVATRPELDDSARMPFFLIFELILR